MSLSSAAYSVQFSSTGGEPKCTLCMSPCSDMTVLHFTCHSCGSSICEECEETQLPRSLGPYCSVLCREEGCEE